MIAARFVVDVQSVISREKDPTEFGVVSIGAIQGGTAANIIPDEVVLTGTIRSFKPEVRAKMHRRYRADSEGGRRHVECAGAAGHDHRGHQGRDE